MQYGWVNSEILNGEEFQGMEIFAKAREFARRGYNAHCVSREDPLENADHVIARILLNSEKTGITEFYADDDGVITIIMDDGFRKKAVQEILKMQRNEGDRMFIFASLRHHLRIPAYLLRKFCPAEYSDIVSC